MTTQFQNLQCKRGSKSASYALVVAGVTPQGKTAYYASTPGRGMSPPLRGSQTGPR